MKKRYLAACSAVFFLCSLALATECLSRSITARVRRVIDGDTVVIEGGERVRYVGIDTPERGEPFYGEARERNRSLVQGRVVRLEICDEEERDKYGRLLAFVYVDAVFVNRLIIEDGLARRLIIPPCGLPVAVEFKRLERRARKRRLGLWGPLRRKTHPPAP